MTFYRASFMYYIHVKVTRSALELKKCNVLRPWSTVACNSVSIRPWLLRTNRVGQKQRKKQSVPVTTSVGNDMLCRLVCNVIVQTNKQMKNIQPRLAAFSSTLNYLQ